jgi:TolB protein
MASVNPSPFRVGAVVASLALLTALVSAAPVAATPPGINGRILFHRIDGDGFAQLFTANPDLTAEHQLTALQADSGWGSWSPDATSIAFDTDRTDPDLNDSNVINDVYVMHADGSNPVRLTSSVGFSGDPYFSPDGEWIVFDSDRGGPLSVYLMRSDGSDVRRLTTPPSGSYDSEPRFSPDGRQIVFDRYQDGQMTPHGRLVGDPSALFVVNVDGTGLQRIMGWGQRVQQADWSPDGIQIVYEGACCYQGDTDLHTISPLGGAPKDLTHGDGISGLPSNNLTAIRFDGYYDPVYSPDGTLVLFGHEHFDGTAVKRGLATIHTDGTGMQWVSPNVAWEHQPDWGTAPLQ